MERLERLERLFLKNCQYNNLPGVNQCLAYGIDVNAKNQNGSALILACNAGHSAIVTRLIQGDQFWLSLFSLHWWSSYITALYYIGRANNCIAMDLVVF